MKFGLRILLRIFELIGNSAEVWNCLGSTYLHASFNALLTFNVNRVGPYYWNRSGGHSTRFKAEQ
jgi:hypothetical protein